MSLKLSAALKLAAKGFRVFPLSPNSKIPLKGFTDFATKATIDPEQITKWFANQDLNIGIVTDNLLVVDVDTKDKKKNGIETMARLNREGKIFPPTTQQMTTTNGAHLIYLTPHPVKNGVSKLGPGLDTRGKGGYIVAAGSTINGKEYTIDQTPVRMAPDWLVDACAAATQGKPQAMNKVEGVDIERALKRGKEYLAAIPLTTAGGRNDTGYRIANRLKDFGLGKDEVFLTMMDDWKCDPEVDLDELKAIVNSAFRYGHEPQGSDSPEAKFIPVDGEENLIPDEDHPLVNLNKEYAFVTVGSGHQIIRETFDEDGDFALEYLKEETFHRKLASRLHQTGDGKLVPLTSL